MRKALIAIILMLWEECCKTLREYCSFVTDCFYISTAFTELIVSWKYVTWRHLRTCKLYFLMPATIVVLPFLLFDYSRDRKICKTLKKIENICWHLVKKNTWLWWESINVHPTSMLFTLYYLMIHTVYIFSRIWVYLSESYWSCITFRGSSRRGVCCTIRCKRSIWGCTMETSFYRVEEEEKSLINMSPPTNLVFSRHVNAFQSIGLLIEMFYVVEQNLKIF